MASRWQDMPRYRRGPPAVVFFHGFQATTATLESAGWRIAERTELDYSFRGERIELVLTEPCGNLKIRGFAEIGGGDFRHRDDCYPIVIHAKDAAHQMITRVIESEMPSFREIDMSHTIMDRMSSIQWGSVFPPRGESKQDLFLGKADMGVLEHLEAIKRLQAPVQKELRAKATQQPIETVARLIRVA